MTGLRTLDAFVAVDVETANSDQSSICALGLAVFRKGEFVHGWQTLVNPECEFDKFNISIHGIQARDVLKAPTLDAVAKVMWRALDNVVVVSHTGFDKNAIKKAGKNLHVNQPRCIWLDSSLVARRTWSQFASRGYGLKPVCDYLGYSFAHHNALEDAKAAGHIILCAMQRTSSSFSDLLTHCYKGHWQTDAERLHVARNPLTTNGPLVGEVVVFTGNLPMGRFNAAEQAAALGCRVADVVNEKTSILVVGAKSDSQNQEHSGKLQKALDFQRTGHSITILNANQFSSLLEDYSPRFSAVA